MLDGRKPGRDPSTHPARRRIGRDQVRVLCLEPLELLHEGVEFGVGDLGIAQDVVPFFVIPDLTAKLCDPFGGIHSGFGLRASGFGLTAPG